MNPYRALGKVLSWRPIKRRKVHSYVSTHDAEIIEHLWKWKPSDGYETLADLFLRLEGDFAKMLMWSSFGDHCKVMANELLRVQD